VFIVVSIYLIIDLVWKLMDTFLYALFPNTIHFTLKMEAARPSKRWYLTTLHGVTIQKNMIGILIGMKTSHLTQIPNLWIWMDDCHFHSYSYM